LAKLTLKEKPFHTGKPPKTSFMAWSVYKNFWRAEVARARPLYYYRKPVTYSVATLSCYKLTQIIMLRIILNFS